jgi:uncharacterized membrane protein
LTVIPGYAILAACVPSGGPISGSNPANGENAGQLPRRFSGLEWWVLSVAISMLVVPAVAVVLIASPVAYEAPSLGILLALVSGCALIVGAIRRERLPADRRQQPRLREWASNVGSAYKPETAGDVALNLGLVVAVLLLVGSGVYAMGAGPQAADRTELSLLTENESGEYVASGYPSTVESGESIPIVLGVGNHEGQPMEYTLVIQEQRLEGDEVIERNRLQTINASVSDGVTGRDERLITPTAEPGETVRITVLLYDDSVPETPTTENAYRHAYFWTTIDDPDDSGDDTDGIEIDDDESEDIGGIEPDEETDPEDEGDTSESDSDDGGDAGPDESDSDDGGGDETDESETDDETETDGGTDSGDEGGDADTSDGETDDGGGSGTEGDESDDSESVDDTGGTEDA